MYTNYVQKYAGVSEEGKPQWYYTDKQTSEMKTTTTYSQADLYLCGDAVPDLYGGINTSLSFYGFDFSAQINYSIGGQAYDYGYQALMSPPTSTHLGYNVHKDKETRSHTDNFGENNVKCLIAKGICRFVPHSSAGGF